MRIILEEPNQNFEEAGQKYTFIRYFLKIFKSRIFKHDMNANLELKFVSAAQK